MLDDSTGQTHRCATEAEVYRLLGLEYIEPELRENRGELEAAAAHAPNLIALEDLYGDLHCHTTASDGTASIEQMAGRLAGRAISTWPSPTTRPVRLRPHVSPEQLRAHAAAIRATEVDGIHSWRARR